MQNDEKGWTPLFGDGEPYAVSAHDGIAIYQQEGGVIVGHVIWDDEIDAERRALAHVLAGGPELYDANRMAREALAELLEAHEISPDDLPAHEYEAIVSDAKNRSRQALAELDRIAAKARGETA